MENENENIQTIENGNQPAPGSQPARQEQTVNLGLRTFTQEQLDAIIARERTKATKGWFSAEQMAAKDSAISALTTERDTAKADLEKSRTELTALKNEKYLSGKGVPADMLEFYAFKIGKLVDDKTSFEKAAEEYLKDNPPAGTVRMSTGGGVNNSNVNQSQKPNDIMNALIRGAK